MDFFDKVGDVITSTSKDVVKKEIYIFLETVKNHYGKSPVLYATDSFYKDYIENVLGIHERKSTKLIVCDNYKEIFKVLKTYIENENKTLNDKTLENEIDILDKLI